MWEGNMTTNGPVTSLHYAANGNFVNGVFAPATDGFNLADVSSADLLNYLPANVKGLVYLGMTDGVTSAFIAAVNACIGNPHLYGFYLTDDPDASATTAANLKAEADYIAAHVPGAISFMSEQNLSANTTPSYYYTPANTDINLFGLGPYPVNTNVPNSLDYNIIPLAVAAAEAAGIPLADIVPIYQAFGGGQYTTYILPTAAQEQQILATWAAVTPHPVFDYAYSWGVQLSDTAIANDPALQAVFAEHDSGNAIPPPTVTITSLGGPTNQANQTIGGTVDLADAGSTVVILDGAAQIGTVVSSAVDGSWSATVTLSSYGPNVLTATDTDATGTGTSNAITYTLATGALPPSVTITSTGVTTSSATQTITGTVDLADAGSTVTILDGSLQIGTAAVGANGVWTTGVTLANAGANVLTATDANSAGTGVSNSVTYTLAVPPSFSIAQPSLSVTGRGGTAALGITETAPAAATNVTLTIKGLPTYETITDHLDGKTFSGVSVTLTEAEVNSGLTLKSNYRGTGHPVAPLTVTGSDTIGGLLTTSAAQTLTVTDPPPTTAGASARIPDFLQQSQMNQMSGLEIFGSDGLGAATGNMQLALFSHDAGIGFDHNPTAAPSDLWSFGLAAYPKA
jgi:hypothetical protein